MRRLQDRRRHAAVERLLEIHDLHGLLDEITRTAERLARARTTELLLTEGARPRRGDGRDRRARLSAPVPNGRTAGAAGATERRIVLPLRAGGRVLATLRLQATPRARLEPLRGYLLQAGAALERALDAEMLQRRVRRSEALLDSLPDACLLVLGRDDLVIEVRGQVQGLLGSVGPRLVGSALPSALAAAGLHGLSRAQLRRLLATARRTGRAETTTDVRTADRELELQLTWVHSGAEGELLCILRDIRAVGDMERALLRRNQELQTAAERLKEVDMLKNEFMSNVSHELRTPLTAIIAYTEAMLRTPPDEPTRQSFLRVIAEQGEKLQRLIAGLLDIAKLDSLATELKLQLGSLNEVIAAAVVTVRPTAEKKRVRIQLDLEPDLPPAYLDELRSQQIVWNLLTNAIKFSPAESTITVRTWSRDGRVWAAVRDQGIGIAPEHHQLIFEKFVQVDGSTTRRHGGVGLGLDLVQHLVELHGGSVHVDSALGAGSTFTFSIPIEKRRQPRFGGTRQALALGRRKR